MIKEGIRKFYNSNLSKTIGIYQNRKIKRVVKKFKCLKIKKKYKSQIKILREWVESDTEIATNFLTDNTYDLLRNISLVDTNLWKHVLNKIAKYNFKNLKDKKVIEIMFLCNFAATWSCDELFRLFLKSSQFHPYIVVHHFNNGTPAIIEENFNSTYDFFKKKGYEVYKDNDRKQENANIIFHLSPYNDAFPASLNITTFPLTTININVPYGIYVADLSEFQYNLPSFSMYWRIYDLPFYVDLAPKYTILGSINRVGSGYCKLDALYQKQDIDEKKYWKKTNENQLKIIYAPHHSIGDRGQRFSTFDKNYKIMLEIAKKFSKETNWIMKPHPLLKTTAIQSGLFSNEKEYDSYIEEWDQLPNARVITGGDYFDIFKTSDGMILDSDSFLAEYLYVNKPLMLLSRETQEFSELGLPLSKVLYRVNGDDRDGIEQFIKQVLIERKDILKDKREDFFEKYLDYQKKNGMLASEYIFRDICEHIQNY